MDSRQLRIGYSGSLSYYIPGKTTSVWRAAKQWFWTFKNTTIDASTRSAYHLAHAVHILSTRHCIVPEQLQIELWGDIHPVNVEQINTLGLSSYFHVSGYLPKRLSQEKLMSQDVLFLPLERASEPGKRTLYIPGKLFEYLNTRKPILAACEDSDCEDILRSTGTGICVKPGDIEALALAILKMIEEPELLRTMAMNEKEILRYSFVNRTAELATLLKKIMPENGIKN
jgi:glycosyltransferase involved in cell wall biosynthesis